MNYESQHGSPFCRNAARHKSAAEVQSVVRSLWSVVRKTKTFRNLLAILFLLLLLPAQAQIDINHYLREGYADLNKSNYTSAINRFNTIIQVKPEMLEPYYFRGFCKLRLDDYQGAYADFQRVVELNPYFADGYRLRGVIKSLQQDYQDAMEDFAKALELDPANIDIYTSRGYAYTVMKNYELAVADFDEALKVNRDFAPAYFSRGYAKMCIDDFDGAIDDFTKGIKLNPYKPGGYAQRALAYCEKEDYGLAIADMDHAVELDPQNPELYFNRAIIRYKSNNLTGTMDDYNKVLELNPDNALTYYNRAILNTEIGKTAEAVANYSKVIELSPRNILPYFNRGAVKFESGDYRGAIDDWTLAIGIFPDFAKAYQARSSARYQIGDYAGAKADERTAKLKIDEYMKRTAGDSLLADFADTSYNFRKVIEFDSDFYRADMDDGEVQNRRVVIDLKPLILLTAKMPGDDRVIAVYLPSLEQLNQKSPTGFGLAFADHQADLSVDTVRYLLNQTEQTKLQSNFDCGLYFHQGMLNSVVHNYNQSIKSYSSAISIDPKFELAYLNRAATRYLMIEYINSLDDISPIVTIGGNNNAPRAEVKYEVQTDYSEVIEDLDVAIQLNPQLGIAYYDRGNVKCMSKDFAGAIDDYTRSIEVGPELPQAYYNRGLTLIYLKDKEKGCYDISKAGEMGIEDAYAVLRKYCN